MTLDTETLQITLLPDTYAAMEIKSFVGIQRAERTKTPAYMSTD